MGSELKFSGFNIPDDVAEIVWIHLQVGGDIFKGKFVFPVGFEDSYRVWGSYLTV